MVGREMEGFCYDLFEGTNPVFS